MFQIYFWSVPGGFTVKCPLFTASPKAFLIIPKINIDMNIYKYI